MSTHPQTRRNHATNRERRSAGFLAGSRDGENAATVPGPSRRRADIQGLRALAVVAVVAEHLTGYPRGGFVGVDVFFVISGFLITAQLLGELDASNNRSGAARASLRAYLGTFYRRRVRRLLPAAVVVIGLTVLAARFTVIPARLHAIDLDAVWALLFASNWRFATIGTDYFTADTSTSPLQHYWSLSVEEQFYLGWPILLFAVVVIGRRSGRSRAAGAAPRHQAAGTGRRPAIAVTAAAVTVVSLWYAFAATAGSATTAYFSTFTRVWELGIGAALAAVVPGLRMSARRAAVLSLLGVAVIGYAYVTARSGTGFPAPGALLPCAGAGVVLAAHDSRRATWNPLLTNRAAVFVGDVSYSVYLVHFPVIVLLGIQVASRGAAYYATALLAMSGLALLLHYLVERPVLRSRWLLPERRAVTGRRPGGRRLATVGALAVAVALCVGAGAAYVTIPSDSQRNADLYRRIQQSQRAALGSTPPASSSARATPTGRPTDAIAALGPEASKISTAIDDALRATSYPATLSPSMNDVIAGPQAREPFVRCARIQLAPAGSCTWGRPDAAHLIYLTGDSTAMVWSQALAQVVEHMPGWRLRVATSYGCHFASVVYRNPQTAVQDACARHTRDVTAEITSMRPDVLVVGAAYHSYTPLGANREVTAQEYAAQQLAPMAAVRGRVGREVFLEPPPGGTNPADCYQLNSVPASCAYQPNRRWRNDADVMRGMLTAAGATYLPSSQWFCSRSGYCPPFAAGTPTMRDATHAAAGWMDRLWPAIAESLRARGVLP